MHKGWIFGPALLTLAVTGCGPQKQSGDEPRLLAGPLVKAVYAFRVCNPKKEEIAGTIKITIPDSINGERILRAVKVKKKGGKFGDNAAKSDEPFDVFLKYAGLGDVGYAQVRVVLRDTNKWRFHTWADPADPSNPAKKFFGVGTNDRSDDVLCGVHPLVTPSPAPTPSPTPTGDPDDAPGDRSVAIFYVDLKALAGHKDETEVYEAPFTIGIVAGDSNTSGYKTPILIDPKVRNDGGR